MWIYSTSCRAEDLRMEVALQGGGIIHHKILGKTVRMLAPSVGMLVKEDLAGCLAYEEVLATRFMEPFLYNIFLWW